MIAIFVGLVAGVALAIVFGDEIKEHLHNKTKSKDKNDDLE
jgi:hypothetical protein